MFAIKYVYLYTAAFEYFSNLSRFYFNVKIFAHFETLKKSLIFLLTSQYYVSLHYFANRISEKTPLKLKNFIFSRYLYLKKFYAFFFYALLCNLHKFSTYYLIHIIINSSKALFYKPCTQNSQKCEKYSRHLLILTRQEK